MILLNSQAVDAIKLTAHQTTNEMADSKIPFLKSQNHLPDYSIYYKDSEGKWHETETIKNKSAKEGLIFKLAKKPAYKLVEKIKVVDSDIGPDKVLEEIVVDDKVLKGNMFSYELQRSFNIGAGTNWFFSTKVGQAILIGIMIAAIRVYIYYWE